MERARRRGAAVVVAASLWKAAVLAAVPAALVAILFQWIAAGAVDAHIVLDWFGTPVTKLIAFASDRVGGPHNRVSTFIAGKGFAAVAFANYWIGALTFLVGTKTGSR